jgi:hypothetical protein
MNQMENQMKWNCGSAGNLPYLLESKQNQQPSAQTKEQRQPFQNQRTCHLLCLYLSHTQSASLRPFPKVLTEKTKKRDDRNRLPF